VTRPVRLALLAASPVYYQAPLYRRLAADPRLDFTAIFASTSGVRGGAMGYGEPVAWDVDALSGYRSVFLRRADRNEIDTGSLLALRDIDVVPAIARGRYEVLWLHSWYSATHLLAAATQLALRRPLLYRDDQTLLNRRAAWKRALKTPLLRALFGNAYGLYVGGENRRWFERYGVRPERCSFVPNCVDNDALAAAASKLAPHRDAIRARLGITPESGPVILSVARLIPKKQPEFLLEAFRRVREQQRCTLLLVGAGELEPELRRIVTAQRIPDVVFAGFFNQSRVAEAYVASDVFALLSARDETWGMTVNEAMNFALPLVLSDAVGSAPDLLDEGVNGHVVSARDVEAAAAALLRLVESEALRRRLGEASRRKIADWTYARAAEGVVRAVAAAVGPARWRLTQREAARSGGAVVAV
jgi:glycosyltransferase involved in cell wall biosynthesis